MWNTNNLVYDLNAGRHVGNNYTTRASMYEEGLVLNNPRGLICQKRLQTKLIIRISV